MSSRHEPIQDSFNGGIWSPRMHGRTSIEKYRTACADLLNFNLMPQGPIHRRSGARFVGELADSSKKGWLIPFVFSDDAAYVISFEEGIMRFYTEEGRLLEATTQILSASEVDSTTDEIVAEGHGYSHAAGPFLLSTDDTFPGGTDGTTQYFVALAQATTIDPADIDFANDEFDIPNHGYSDQMGPFRLTTSLTLPTGTQANTDYYIVVVDANTFSLSLTPGGAAVTLGVDAGTGIHQLVPEPELLRDRFRITDGLGGAIVDITSAGVGTHTFAPVDADPIEVEHPYLESELPDLSYAQSADVLYICHPNHPPRKLQRFSFWSFVLDVIDFIDGPYLAENITDVTIAASATTGQNITLTASEPLFLGSDVGRLVRRKGNAHWGYAVITQISPFTFDDADITSHTFVLGDVNTGTDQIAITSHGFADGEKVRFRGGSLPTTSPAGLLDEDTDVWAFGITANAITLHTSEADALTGANAINITVAGPGTVTGSRINVTTHGFAGSEGPLFLSNAGGGIPLGLSETQGYFIRYHDANSFSLAETRGGDSTGIDLAAMGGTHSLHGDGQPVTTVRADVLAEFQSTAATEAWRLGAWSPAEDLGYPRAVTFHEQRLWFAGNVGAPQTLYASKTADFEAFSPTGDITDTATDLDDSVDDDNAIVYAIGANRVDAIRWLQSSGTLLVGTKASTWSGQSPSVSGESVTPSNFQVLRASSRGSAGILPILVDHQTIWVSSTQLKVLGFSFDSIESRELVEDLTILADQVTRSGVVDLDYAEEPWNQVWCVLDNGLLAVLTHSFSEQVTGWARARLGGTYVAAFDLTLGTVDTAENQITITSHGLKDGDRVQFQGGAIPAPFVQYRDYYVDAVDDDTLAFYGSKQEALAKEGAISITATGTGSLGLATHAVVESLSVIPAPDGDPSSVGRTNRAHDQVWVQVKRTINGTTKRYIEFIEDHFEDDEGLEDGFFLDSGITAVNGSPTTAISGLSHLANATVDVLADGQVYREQLVNSSGELTLAEAATLVHIGFRQESVFESLRLRTVGTALRAGGFETTLGRIDHLVLRLLASMGGKYGTDLLSLDELDLIPADHDMDAVAPAFTDDIEVAFDGEWNTDAKVFVVQDDPLPLTVLSLNRKLQKGERGARS